MAERRLDCAFCSIANAILPAHVVYEDKDFVAFLDSRPLFPGHVLLCPREHYETLLDLPKHLAGSSMTALQLLAQAVQSALDA